MRVGAQIVAAAFLITGAAMILGVFGADTGTDRLVCFVLALIFLPLGFLCLRLRRSFGSVASTSPVVRPAAETLGDSDYARAEARESAILARGMRARATVIRTTDATGDAWPAVTAPRLVGFELNVQPDGGAPPYLVSVRHTIPASLPDLPEPGTQLAVRVDPDDHAAVAIDWRAAAD